MGRAAGGDLIVLGLFGTICAELSLRGIPEDPVHLLVSTREVDVPRGVLGVPGDRGSARDLERVVGERDALDDAIRYVAILTVLTALLLAARMWTRQLVTSVETQPRFEEEAYDQVTALNVWDGLRNVLRDRRLFPRRPKKAGGRPLTSSPPL